MPLYSGDAAVDGIMSAVLLRDCGSDSYCICCILRALKTSRKHHTQLKYVRRLEYNKKELEKLDMDDLNKFRWSRPACRIPVLVVHRSRTWYGREKLKHDVEDELEELFE